MRRVCYPPPPKSPSCEGNFAKSKDLRAVRLKYYPEGLSFAMHHISRLLTKNWKYSECRFLARIYEKVAIFLQLFFRSIFFSIFVKN